MCVWGGGVEALFFGGVSGLLVRCSNPILPDVWHMLCVVIFSTRQGLFGQSGIGRAEEVYSVDAAVAALLYH